MIDIAMKIYYGTKQFPKLAFGVVTTGTFDGVHLGHQKILSNLVKTAQQNNGNSVVVTFHPHPRVVLGQEVQELSTLAEKELLLAQNGIDYLVVLPFNTELAQLSAEEFIQKIYIQELQTKKMVIGYDHHFGKNREGNFDYIQKNISKYPFQIQEIPREDIDNVGVSSTKIRNALLDGNIEVANKYLGRFYELTGAVVKGDQIGRTIGFPTANLQIESSQKLIPADGIYAVKVTVSHKKYDGMLYIGKRPTLPNVWERRIEVNIFDFNEDIYGKKLTLNFVTFIRADARLNGLEALKQQLKDDEIKSRMILSKISN
jgi:riboflavin kinase / FMN adenylyltransferase